MKIDKIRPGVFAFFMFISSLSCAIDNPMIELPASTIKPASPATSSLDLVNKGAILLNQGKSIEAEKILSDAVKNNPVSPEAFYNYALALSFNGNVIEAASASQKAIELKKDFPAARLLLGTSYLTTGKPLEALKAFSAALSQIDNDNVCYLPALFNKAVALGKLEKYTEAEACFAEVLASNPDDPAPAFQIGVLKIKQKKWDQALEWLDASKSAFPLEAAILSGKANVEMGNKELAAEHLEKAKVILMDSSVLAADVKVSIASEVENLQKKLADLK
ncbi:MAG: tetratricopeptide repeat protein [Candidatus Riflebacteria bacterium]|nr:tetratricopeptide repeat protein [Candidatus Riflebacteria bacterium]